MSENTRIAENLDTLSASYAYADPTVQDLIPALAEMKKPIPIPAITGNDGGPKILRDKPGVGGGT
jgi:hypothetical protein